MKKLILALLFGAIAHVATAQCIDTVGINANSIQNGYLIQSGWGVNADAGGAYLGEVRIGKIWNFYSATWNNPGTVTGLPNPCTGWIQANMIDLSTLHNFDVVQYRVSMFTASGAVFKSRIATYAKMPRSCALANRMAPEGQLLSQMIDVSKVVVTGTDADIVEIDMSQLRTSIGDDESLRFENPFDQTAIFQSGDRMFTIVSPAEEMTYNLTVVNLLGQPVYTSHVETQEATLTLPALPTGIYLFEMTTPDGMKSVHKVFIQ